MRRAWGQGRDYSGWEEVGKFGSARAQLPKLSMQT